MTATRADVITALRANAGNVRATARQLGIADTSLRERIDRSPELARARDEARQPVLCPSCGASIRQHPRCRGCSLLVGPGHWLRSVDAEGYCQPCAREGVCTPVIV